MDELREAQARIDSARRHRPAERRDSPPSLEDALRRVLSGEVTPWASDEQIARYEATQARRQREEMLRATRLDGVLTGRMREAALDGKLGTQGFTSPALDRVRRWVVRQAADPMVRPIFVLFGDPGLGKTVAAAWLLMSEGGRYIEAEELRRLHAAQWGEEREEYRRVIGKRVLVVDELGTEERSVAVIHDVVNKRQSGRLTLMIGNLSWETFRQRYDVRTVDRLREVAAMAELTGESLRRGAL